MNRLALGLATWFGCGYFPWGPGTVGSAVAVIIAFFLHTAFGGGRLWLLVLVLVLVAPAIWASTRTAQILNSADPGSVVVDEVLGQWVTLLGSTVFLWKTVLAAFLVFRLLDIWKPWPIRSFENLPGGFGIVADDLAAGLYGALILYLGGIFRLY